MAFLLPRPLGAITAASFLALATIGCNSATLSTLDPNKPAFTSRPNASEATFVDPRRLEADPDRYKGENILLYDVTASVEQYNEFTWIIFGAIVGRADLSANLVLQVYPADPDLLRNKCVEVRGIGNGTDEVVTKNTGATYELPRVDAYSVTSIGCLDAEVAAGLAAE